MTLEGLQELDKTLGNRRLLGKLASEGADLTLPDGRRHWRSPIF
ncbi:MAG: hypothetical protein ACREX3_20755 [Gammaproteobacteria bacterium]